MSIKRNNKVQISIGNKYYYYYYHYYNRIVLILLQVGPEERIFVLLSE